MFIFYLYESHVCTFLKIYPLTHSKVKKKLQYNPVVYQLELVHISCGNLILQDPGKEEFTYKSPNILYLIVLWTTILLRDITETQFPHP